MAGSKQPSGYLTNEHLMKHFPNSFALGLSAIDSAKALIHSGKEFRLGQLLDAVARSHAYTEEKELQTQSHTDVD